MKTTTGPLDVKSIFDAAFSRETGVTDEDRGRVLRLVELLPPEAATVLDVGCGSGCVARAVAATGREVTGMDLSSVAVAKVRQDGIRCVEAGIDAIPSGDREFDLVMCCEVLEHLDDGLYEQAIRELTRVARQWIVLTVPNRDHLATLRFNCPECGSFLVPWGHIRSFQPGDMNNLVPGFDCIHTEAFGPPIADGFRPLTRMLRLPRAYHSPLKKGMQCRQCGYLETRGGLEVVRSLRADRALAAATGKLSFVVETRIAPKCPRWLFGLYRRSSATR